MPLALGVERVGVELTLLVTSPMVKPINPPQARKHMPGVGAGGVGAAVTWTVVVLLEASQSALPL